MFPNLRRFSCRFRLGLFCSVETDGNSFAAVEPVESSFNDGGRPIDLTEATSEIPLLRAVLFTAVLSRGTLKATGEHSGIKVRSAVIRQIKHAFEAAGISMPDEAREVVFPAGVPVHMISEGEEHLRQKPDKPSAKSVEAGANAAEGVLANEAHDIEKQAQKSRVPEAGSNLLEYIVSSVNENVSTQSLGQRANQLLVRPLVVCHYGPGIVSGPAPCRPVAC